MLTDMEKAYLPAMQAACLSAIRNGHDRKSTIALAAGCDLRRAARALEALSWAKLICRVGHSRWRPTKLGESCHIDVVAEAKRQSNRKPPGRPLATSTVERLLALLDRPMRGDQLVEALGVTRQRVHELVVRLHAQGRVRVADPERALLMVARRDDPSLLLTRDEARVLSALPNEDWTTISRLVGATSFTAARARKAVAGLREHGLVESALGRAATEKIRLTDKGREHIQRSKPLNRARGAPRIADLAPLKVKSDRVFSVLSHLAENGQARSRDMAAALQIPFESMNALMQYLKRRGLVRKVGDSVFDPHGLTEEGVETLALMRQRRRQSEQNECAA